MMYHHEMYREHRDELLRRAEHQRLLREARKAKRKARGNDRERPVIDRPSPEAFRKAA